MPRIFYGNFDFEHELAAPSYNRSKQLERLNAELSIHLLAFADDGDRLFYDDDSLAEFLTDAATAGFPNAQTLALVNQPIPDAELVPWGWSRPAISIGTSRGWSGNGPAHGVVAIVNSRTFSFEAEQRLDFSIPGAVRIDSIEMLEVAINQAGNIWNRSVEEFDWLLKAEFGMSGRERVTGTGSQLEDSQAGWIRRRLNSGGGLYFEPRVEPLCELSSQWLIPRPDSGGGLSMEPDLIGTTQLLVDRSGQYLGSILVDRSSVVIPSIAVSEFSLSRENLDHLLQGARSVAKAAQQAGYHGPLGIDSMVYRGVDGQPAARAIQDVNARLTMGRIALEWFRRFAKTDRPAWLLVPEVWLDERGVAAALDNPAARLTSPRAVAGHPVRRVGVLIDDRDDWRKLLTTDLRP